MKKLILISSLVIIALSCSRSNDTPEAASETPVLLTKVISQDGTTSHYKYNGTKVSEILYNYGYKDVFTYNEDVITKIISYNSNGAITETIDFTYENNVLKTVSISNAANTSKTVYSYSYPNSSTVVCTKIRNYMFNGSMQTVRDINTLTTNNGNVISEDVVYYYNNVLSGNITANYTYDDKKNPTKNITGFNKISIFIFDYIGENTGTSNNMLSKSQLNVLTNGSSSSYTNTNTITYNSNGYPTQIIEKQHNGSTLNSAFVTNYEYNK